MVDTLFEEINPTNNRPVHPNRPTHLNTHPIQRHGDE